ncbi:MAG: hypothetical protein H5T61_00795 [Thermoflexales bacterium]|nr:hypothetical protein [Thermoflexales bacterium]
MGALTDYPVTGRQDVSCMFPFPYKRRITPSGSLAQMAVAFSHSAPEIWLPSGRWQGKARPSPDYDLLNQRYVQFFRIQSALAEVDGMGIKIVKRDQVQDYLRRYPEMIDLLPKVARLVQEQLPDARLVLTVYQDPEEEDEYLTIYARFAKYDKCSLERVRITRSRYRDMLRDCQGWIFLTTDFQTSDRPYAV